MLRRGHLHDARTALDRLPPGDARVAHLDALLSWQEGRIADARSRFADALRRQRNAAWMADRADFEVAQGAIDEAARWFREAIAADPPAASPWRLRLGLALLHAERIADALAVLEALVQDVPHSPLAWQTLGACRRLADDHLGSLDAFGRVLSLKPGDPLALLSRAHVLGELGRPAAAAFVQALQADPQSSQARRALATVQAVDGRYDVACEVLRDRLAADPSWADGWQTLASLAHQREGKAAFLAVADEALLRARDGAGKLPVLQMLSLAGEHLRVLDAIGRTRRSGDTPPEVLLLEAVALDETARPAEARRIFDVLAPHDHPAIDLPRIRHALRTGNPHQAASIAERLIAHDPQSPAWSYLATAWRMLGDPRSEWLEGDPRLVGVYELGLSPDDLFRIAARLRALHSAVEAPFEQSMRGGTQTDGHLLSREGSEFDVLRATLRAAITEHLAQLPPHDPSHPTLRHTVATTRFSGSWSVRLTGGGFHVNHVHSEGWFSSACYIAVPDDVATGGRLALGEPPRELGTGIAAARMIPPAPGRLVLFPSTMWHGTTSFAEGERLTVAFDLKPLS